MYCTALECTYNVLFCYLQQDPAELTVQYRATFCALSRSDERREGRGEASNTFYEVDKDRTVSQQSSTKPRRLEETHRRPIVTPMQLRHLSCCGAVSKSRPNFGPNNRSPEIKSLRNRRSYEDTARRNEWTTIYLSGASRRKDVRTEAILTLRSPYPCDQSRTAQRIPLEAGTLQQYRCISGAVTYCSLLTYRAHAIQNLYQ